MAEVEGVCSVGMEYESTAVICRPAEMLEVPVGVLSEENIHRVDIIEPKESREWKKKHSKQQIILQKKKELYTKLDEILVFALREEFEMCAGHSIDRIEMIEFLTSVVNRHLTDCPELQKVLDLRDTVLTGRVKKAFPRVEFKRKQMRREHHRKVWIYVNIRRKLSRTPIDTPAQTSHKATPTKNWTPLAATPSNPAPQTPSSPVSEDTLASFCPHPNTSYERCHSTPLEVAESVSPSESSPESVCGFDGVLSCLSACNSYDNQSTEGNGLLIDGVAMQRWVVSHYVQDDTSFVPVQDVVKAFKEEYNVDLSYKECHQMILSAFTTPRNRLIAKKTVRVSTFGQQYVYRGIAPINKAICPSDETKDPEASKSDQLSCQSENPAGENAHAWRQKIRDITDERDQALMERNQALAAFMELETKHDEAKQTIEKLRKEILCKSVAEKSSEALNETRMKEGFCLRSPAQRFSVTQCDGNCDNFSSVVGKDSDTDLNNKHCDWLLLRDVVTQAKEERDCLLKRLEIVKSERNSYLDRLHSLEKENQQLKDDVGVRNSELPQSRLLDDISRHFQTRCQGENNAKGALSSALSHLKSKRKQISPSRLTKSPKYENSSLNEVHKEPNSLDQQTASQEVCAHSPIPTHREVSSPGNLTAFNGERFIDKEGLCNIVSSKISNNSVSNNSTVVSHGEEQESNDDFLVFTSGSEMIGFTRHPLED